MKNDVRMIDANALKKSLRESYEELVRERDTLLHGEEWEIADAQLVTFLECIMRVKEQPTINPKSLRPVASWEIIDPKTAKCTRCGRVATTNGKDLTGKGLIFAELYKYCPNCGAWMKGENDG